MPPRPSQNLDRALLAAGRALLPRRGCAGLSVREVAEAAGVNLGMFHYHFKSREAFLRALLQEVYEEMYGQLAAERAPGDGRAVDWLREALRTIARFLRNNRPVLARVMADALCGDPIAVDFLHKNAPRHLQVLSGLIAQAQRAGDLRPVPLPQALAFCAGALALPILFAGAAAESGALDARAAKALSGALLSDAAIDERVDMALAAMAAQAAAPARRRTTPRRGAP